MYDKRGTRIDVAALLRSTTQREQPRQCPAFVHVGDSLIAGRLCWLRIPKDKVAQARQRAERESEGPCDAETLAAAEFVVIFTTVLHELSAAQVLTLYRARWQVELEFKRAKSIRELDRLPNFLPETIHSWICAKLLLQMVVMRIASQSAAFPPGGTQFDIQLLPAFPPTTAPRSARRPRAMVRRAARMGRHLRRAPARDAL